ncbi:MAG TPA: ABC transporter [Oceanospirillales bacterium]|nr:ABC transporter [Oceanospirillales bacterium]|tara:strand:+ start:956 stop:1900 length:945 start_codon:yes stop_codon:yes gene_type:complete
MTALSIQGLEKVYGNGFKALKGIDLTVKRGDFFALLGPNGAGKSTTLGIVSSLVQKTSGTVSIMGHDLVKDTFAAKQCLGVVPQEFNFNQFEKVYDIIITQAGYYGLTAKQVASHAETLLRALDLWDKRNESARMLSGGMKRRLMIARALIHKPQILILDEPTAGVDIELRRSMWEFMKKLNEEGTTIILTTHYLEEAEQLCKNIAIINNGEIVTNTSVKALLGQLKTETFVLDVDGDLEGLPELKDYQIRHVDNEHLEVVVDKGQGLNEVFSALTEAGIQVLSMRTKANRLEELFVDLVQDDNEVANQQTKEA